VNSPSAQEKALSINLDGTKYGTIAEIGAGQEVARWFFHVGKASSTVARSVSAYDMAISDWLYGPTPHYVSRARLESMLDTEFGQLTEQLGAARGERNSFFVFADTVATHMSSRTPGGHGWLGVRFQDRPKALPSEIIIHIELTDAFMANRQEAVGLVGVNLIHGAFTSYQDPAALIRSLMDGLDRRRIEIDMIKFSGPLFSGVDNRLMALQLVEQGLTDAAMFTAAGDVIQPSEILHGRPVVIERGSFRPVTNVTLAMLDAAVRLLTDGAGGQAGEPAIVMEMTLKNLMTGPSIDHQDFLARADTLGALDKMVMISSHTRFDTVTTYLRQYTQEKIGFVAGVPTLLALLDERYYEPLDGGILEGLGRLFQGPVKLFVYPTVSGSTGELETAEKLALPHIEHLYAHLFENGLIVPVREFDQKQLHVTPGDVLEKIQAGDPTWTDYVPAPAAEVIRKKRYFGAKR
jgi:hypothetical protein